MKATATLIAESERDHHRATKARAMRTKAGELEKRAYTISHSIAAMDAERTRCWVEAEALRWRAESLLDSDS